MAKLESWTVQDKMQFPTPTLYEKGKCYEQWGPEESDSDKWETSANSPFSMDKIRDEEFVFKNGTNTLLRPRNRFFLRIPGLDSATIEILHNKDDPDVYLRFESKVPSGRALDWGEYKTLYFEVSLKSNKDDWGLHWGESDGKTEEVWEVAKASAIPLQKRDLTDCPCQQSALFMGKLCHVDDLKEYMIFYENPDNSDCFRLELPIQVSVKLSKTFTDFIPGDQRHRICKNENSMNFMKKLLSDALHSDFTIRVGETTFPCHKNILAGQSEVFAAMFDSKMSETNSKVIEISDMSAAAVEAFLKYLYYKDVEGPVSNCAIAFEVLLAADKYQVKELESESRKIVCFMAAKKFDAKKAFEIFEFCGMVEGFKDVQEKAARVFKENAVKYGETGEFVTVLRDAKPESVAKLFQAMALL